MKWITATDLERWADSKAAEGGLPYLVSSLIRASAPDATAFRFPAGDSSQIPGYDGRLESEGFPPYVPEGKSVWEFGTGEKYRAKADEDYEKRTKEPRAATPAETTLVFVTPRTWSHPDVDEWIKEKKEQGVWKDIRVIDAVALEDWLDRKQAVAAKLARELNVKPATGAMSTDEFWSEYSSRFKPPLTEKVILAARNEDSELVLQQLQGATESYLWQGDSTDEVIAFVVASIRMANEEARKYLEARVLVVHTEEALRHLAKEDGLILLPRSGALLAPGLFAQRSPTIVPVGRDEPNRRQANPLKRPTYHEMADALQSMGYVDDAAYALARACGRSVTILARRIQSSTYRKPEWAKQTELIPAMLAGAWRASAEEDKQAVQALTDLDYAAYEKLLLPYLRMQEDPPLEREGDVWTVRAPVDMFVHLGSMIGANDLAKFQEVVKQVFGENDPSLELPPGERFYAGLSGKKLKHSDWLRTGLATTLLLIAVFHDEAGLEIVGTTPEAFVNGLVSGIPGLDNDYRAVASLHGVLSLIAEAAPRPLLKALGLLLEGDGERIKPIFQDTEGAWHRSSPHTGVLWALEVLAWDPEYLNDATLTLAKLERVDPGGKLVNRPLHSLREIFIVWHPSTNATLGQRLSALDNIVKYEPQIGWELLIKLLPEYHGVASLTAKPRYREAGASGREEITYGFVAKSYREIIDRVLTLVGDDPKRWVTLIRQVGSFSPEDRIRVTDLLDPVSEKLSGNGRTEVWSALRAEVNRNRRFQDADWAMAEEDLTRLDAMVARLQPADIGTQVLWLFSDYHPDLPDVKDIQQEIQQIPIRRKEAVQQLYAAKGIVGVLELAKLAKLPTFVGYALAEAVDHTAPLVDALGQSLANGAQPGEFEVALSSAADFRFTNEWRSAIETQLRRGEWSPMQVAQLMLAWRDQFSTWDFVESLGGEVEANYWSRKPSRPIRGDDRAFEYVVNKYLQYGRALAALDAVWHPAASVPSEILIRLLDAAIPEIAAKPDVVNSNVVYDLEQVFAELRHRSDVPRIDIATREYAYLPLLTYREGELTIHSLLAEDPDLYVGLLCDVFKPASGEEGEITKERQAKATAGYRLLSEFRKVPGAKNSEIDPDALKGWVTKVRELASEKDRAAIADEYIGHLFAHAPPDDKDGSWPHRVIRDLIEEVASEKLEHGIALERFNMRGVTTRGPYDGGDQERAIAAEIRKWSEASTAWPRTCQLLKGIAADWERHAEWHDIRARQDQIRG
jgi:hypothetical protein